MNKERTFLVPFSDSLSKTFDWTKNKAKTNKSFVLRTSNGSEFMVEMSLNGPVSTDHFQQLFGIAFGDFDRGLLIKPVRILIR